MKSILELCEESGKTAEQVVLEAVNEKWGERSIEKMGLKLGEECGEVQAAITKMSEGRATGDDLDAEMGDVLIVLCNLAAKRSWTLEALLRKRFDEIRARWQNEGQSP